MPIIDESQLDPIEPTDLGKISASPMGGTIISEADLDPEPSSIPFSGDAYNVNNIAKGLSYGIPFSDEIGAAFSTFGKKTLGELGDVLTGNDFIQGGWGDVYDQELAKRRQEESQYFDQHPVLANVESLAGSSLLPMPKIDSLKKAAKVGSIIGGTYGFGAGEDGIENRLKNALWGAGVGGITTPVLYGGAKLLGKGYSAVKDLLNVFRKDIEPEAASVAGEVVDRYVNRDALLEALQNPVPETYPGTMRVAERANKPEFMSLTKTLEKTLPEAGNRGEALDAARQSARMTDYLGAQGPIPSKEKTGALVREGLEEGLSGIKEKVKGQFSKAKGKVGIFPVKSMVDDAIRAEAEYGVGIPSSVESYIRTFQRDLPNTIPIQKLQAYRSKTGSMLSGLKRSTDPSDKAGYRVLSQMFKGLADTETKLAESGKGITKGTQKALTKGRELRAEQGQKFETGATGAVLKKDAFGNYRTSETRAVNKVLSGPEEARQTVEALKGQNRSKEALRSNLLEKLKTGSTDNKGNFTQRLINNWKKLKTVADEVLTPNQIKAVDRVSKDILSRSNIEEKAFAPSKGQSLTSQGESSVRLVKDAISTGINRRLGLFSKIFSAIGEGRAKRIQGRVDEILIDLAFDENFAKDFLAKKPTTETIKKIGGEIFARAGIAPEIIRENLIGYEPSATEKPKEKLRPVEEAYNEIQQKKAIETPKILSAKRMKDLPDDVEKEIKSDKYLHAAALAESNMNPKAKNPNSTAEGLFQFIDKTARALGLKDKLDARESLIAMKKLTAENKAVVGNDPEWLYAAHVLGAPLAKKLKQGKLSGLDEKDRKLVRYFQTEALPNFRRRLAEVVQA